MSKLVRRVGPLSRVRLAWPLRLVALVALVALASLAGGACGGPAFSSGGGSDGGVTDGPSPADADAAPPSDGAAAGNDADTGLSFCENSGSHSFCEDFDTAGVPGKFTLVTSSSLVIGNGSKIVADTSTFVSSPNSALAETPALIRQNDQATALLAATIAAPSTSSPATRLKWSAELQVRQDCVANADGAFVALLTTGGYGLALSVLPSQTELVELKFASDGGTGGGISDGGTGDGGIAESVPHGFPAVATERWLALGIELDLRVKTATVTVDGTAVLDTVMLTLSPPSSATSASLFLGAQVSDVQAISTGCHVHVDNVLFDVL